MTTMNCPNCNCQLVRDDYCLNCNRTLIRLNSRLIDKQMYIEAENVHKSVNEFIESAINTEKMIDENIDNPDFYNTINMDDNQRSNILKQMDNSLDSIYIFKENLHKNIINDRNTYEFLLSLDDVLGSVDSLISTGEYHADFLIKRIHEYKDKIESNRNIIADESIVKQVHDSIDDYNNSLLIVENEIINAINDQECLDELRYDKNQRDMIKESIAESYDSLEMMDNEVRTILNDEGKLKYLSSYDFKYGNVREKLVKVLERIEKTRSDIEKIDRYIDSVERDLENRNVSVEYDNTRRLDL